MGTRSHIAILNEDGSVNEIYCNFDSDRNGKILKENFNREDKVRLLIEHGDMSQLKETLTETIFYARDEGEPVRVGFYPSEQHFLDECVEDYTYLFKDGHWYTRKWREPLRKIYNG